MSWRVLYIIRQLGKGGAEQQLYYLLQHLNVEATVLCLSEIDYWSEPLRRLGAEVILLPRHHRLEWRRLKDTVVLIRRLKPDIVHVFVDNIYGRLGALLAQHCRVIVHKRSHEAFESPAWDLHIERWFNHHVQRVVFNSRANYEYMVERGLVSPVKALVIPNGVDCDRFSPRSAGACNWPWPSHWRGRLIVGTVSKLNWIKNPEMFIRCASLVLRKRQGIGFVLAGKGEHFHEMQSLCHDLGIQESVAFMGERHDVPDLLRAMDLFLLTSRVEGMPNVVLEAMATGLPCIVTDAGGSAEPIIEGETGYVVPIDDADGMADRVLHILADDELRLSMGKAARIRVMNEFSVEKMVTRTSQMYLDLMAKSSNLKLSRARTRLR